ncbi:sel1 repeat family protein [Methanocorpusculum sp.]|nr:sel1 repeat family protein [Methanocorpusculum sp.]
MTDIQIDLDLILQNAEAGNPDAQYAMAYHYTLGLGVEKDVKKARDWYRRAAENNHPDAQLALGLYYNHPSYGELDKNEAKYWFSKAAEQGNKHAEQFLIQIIRELSPEPIEEADDDHLVACMHDEAGIRLRELTEAFNLNPKILELFGEGKVCYSHPSDDGEFAYVSLLTAEDRYVQIVEEFEKKKNCLVYHCIESDYTLALLYVCPIPEDWEMERIDPRGYIDSYVYNLTEPRESEFGSIVIGRCSGSGALVRLG